MRLTRKQSKVPAAVSLGFGAEDPLRGPFLAPVNRQTEYAPALLELVQTMLRDDENLSMGLNRPRNRAPFPTATAV